MDMNELKSILLEERIYLLACLDGINLPIKDFQLASKISELIVSSHDRSVAPTEMNAWIKQMIEGYYGS